MGTISKTKLRRGITCAGNWIVDHVKIIDQLPGRGMLGNILSETLGTGGAAFNVLTDLARLKAPFPLSGIGVIGNDRGREFIKQICRPLNINLSGLTVMDGLATSYTDVMTDEKTGDRVFYHCRGANARFDIKHVPVNTLSCRIFHLGYLLLLDGMDEPDADHGTVAARLLKRLQDAGIKTSVDVVSEESDRFRRIVPASLRYTNYLILNEIEVGRTTGHPVRDSQGVLNAQALVEAVEALYKLGEMELVVVHMPEGAYLRTRDGHRLSQGSLQLPEGYIKGAVGAGDAFCAGILYALHEAWEYAEALTLGACAAAASLAHPSATDGMAPLKQVLELSKKFPKRPAPVHV